MRGQYIAVIRTQDGYFKPITTSVDAIGRSAVEAWFFGTPTTNADKALESDVLSRLWRDGGEKINIHRIRNGEQ